jgi:hypothetical protein
MFKKLCLVVLSLVFILFIGIANEAPMFSGYAREYEIYTESASSNARIIKANKNIYPFITAKVGESCKIKGVFELHKFLADMKAEIVLIEPTGEGTSYYAYSKNIRYLKTIRGKRVNLQVFIGKTSVTVGSPIIYGSF